MARLSLRLLPLLFIAAVPLSLATLAPAAQAVAPSTPALTGTNPVSPGASPTPRIQGEPNGPIATVVGPRLTAAVNRPIAMTSGPGNTITIYTDSECTGAVAGEGTVGELEEPGIEVEVAPESVTTFYAKQSNGSESSLCSTESVTYRQVSAAPVAPTFSSVNPASPADDNSPRLIGSADPEATVSIYTNPSCEPPALASGTGAAFAGPGIQVSVSDNSETTFYAKASMAGFFSTCSSTSISYREATVASSGSGTPPSPPHLRMLPGGRANDNTPQVTGSAPGAATVKVFGNSSCGGSPVATGSAAEFGTGLTVHVADNTTNTFTAVSVAGGSASVCSAPVTYVEDSSPPQTRITMGPGVKTRRHKAVFRFTDTAEDPPGTTFLCKVDRGRWKQCSAPFKLRHLRFRRHVLRVRAVDVAGNAEAVGAKRRFKVIHIR